MSQTSLSTGTVAPPGAIRDLLRALDMGGDAHQTFILTTLHEDPPAVKFHENMTNKRQRQNTVSRISTDTPGMKGENVVLKAEQPLFSQVIRLGESRKVNRIDILAHPQYPCNAPCHEHRQMQMGPNEIKQDRICQGA